MTINYEAIDTLIRPIIQILNDNEVKTKWCCQGHFNNDKVYIMFDKSVSEEQLHFLLELFDYFYLEYYNLPTPIERKNQFILEKWIRYVDYGKGELHFYSNWTLKIKNVKNRQRKYILETVENKLKEYFNNK